MRISHSHRFVFFANPKTGSRTVRKLLDDYAEIHGRQADDVNAEFPFYNHMRPVDLRPVFQERGWDFDDYFKFTVVRNPWARAVSLFEMVSYRDGGWLSRIRTAATRHQEFRAWVPTLDPDGRGAAETDQVQSVRRYGAFTFLGFAGDENGVPLVDQVLRLEDLDAELPSLLERLEIPAPSLLPHIGRGRYRGDHRAYYDDETRDLVAALYADDIERFGYSF